MSSYILKAFQSARTAAAGIFETIRRQSEIDSSSEEGKKLSNEFQSDIEFRNVTFSYPSRNETSVLNGINLKIRNGETIALVGSSGSGKSTIIQLVQKFYCLNSGEILLNGVNIKELNTGWLREQIGVVGQEPVLFDASIEENIRLGANLQNMNNVKLNDIVEASKEANAHDFVSGLQDGYQTYVGDRGAQLSGKCCLCFL